MPSGERISLLIQRTNIAKVQAAVANIGLDAGCEFKAKFTLPDITEQGKMLNIGTILGDMACVTRDEGAAKGKGKATYTLNDPRYADPSTITSVTLNGKIFQFGSDCLKCRFRTDGNGCVILDDFNDIR